MNKGGVPIDTKFWNERVKQPYCLTVIKFNHVGCAMLPFDQVNHNKLIEQWNERIERARKI